MKLVTFMVKSFDHSSQLDFIAVLNDGVDPQEFIRLVGEVEKKEEHAVSPGLFSLKKAIKEELGEMATFVEYDVALIENRHNVFS